MTYDPPDTISTQLFGDDPAWALIIDNHGAIQEDYAPAIIDQPLLLTQTSTTAATRAHFRVRNNDALHPIRVRVRAGCTVGSGKVTVAVGAVTTDQAVTGAQAWYTIDTTPLVGDPDCYLDLDVDSGGHSLEVTALQVYLAPVAGSDVAGWVPVDSGRWATTDSPIPSRVAEDLLNGVILISTDRPFCTFSRVADVTAVISGKSAASWGTDNSTSWVAMGRAQLSTPLDFVVGGPCRIDAYVTRTGSPEVSIAIGPSTWTFTASTDGWYSTTLTLGNGGPIIVSGLPGASDEVAVRTLQIWRGGI